LFSENPENMKKIFAIFCLGTLVILASCNKKETKPDAGSGSPQDTTAGSGLKFSSLSAADTVIKVNDVTTITAHASGTGLTYQWAATYGTFVGNGTQVQWTVCHEDKFVITCKVTDKNNNSETKQIVIRSHN
jgi:hypothetical protein